jgi:hypothetical protein
MFLAEQDTAPAIRNIASRRADQRGVGAAPDANDSAPVLPTNLSAWSGSSGAPQTLRGQRPAQVGEHLTSPRRFREPDRTDGIRKTALAVP